MSNKLATALNEVCRNMEQDKIRSLVMRLEENLDDDGRAVFRALKVYIINEEVNAREDKLCTK